MELFVYQLWALIYEPDFISSCPKQIAGSLLLLNTILVKCKWLPGMSFLIKLFLTKMVEILFNYFEKKQPHTQ